jgi:hypothetical protein
MYLTILVFLTSDCMQFDCKCRKFLLSVHLFCCRLYRCLLVFMSNLQSISANMSTWASQAEFVFFQVPTWLTQDADMYSLSLSAFKLSVAQLSEVARSFQVSHLRRKNDFVHANLDDFLQQRVLFGMTCSTVISPGRFLCLNIFSLQYGHSVAFAFRDVHSPDHIDHAHTK